jgi:hypothetical protein
MNRDLIDWQWRNARLRSQIDLALQNADEAVREEVDRIARELAPYDLDPIETLRWVNANLRRREKAIEASVARHEMFRHAHASASRSGDAWANGRGPNP